MTAVYGTRDTACVGKTRHDGHDSAARAAIRLADDEGVDRYAVAFYECLWCRGWHVGHRSLDERLRRLRRPRVRRGKLRA